MGNGALATVRGVEALFDSMIDGVTVTNGRQMLFTYVSRLALDCALRNTSASMQEYEDAADEYDKNIWFMKDGSICLSDKVIHYIKTDYQDFYDDCKYTYEFQSPARQGMLESFANEFCKLSDEEYFKLEIKSALRRLDNRRTHLTEVYDRDVCDVVKYILEHADVPDENRVSRVEIPEHFTELFREKKTQDVLTTIEATAKAARITLWNTTDALDEFYLEID